MRRPAVDEYRLRLEGRAELLEAARLLYRTVLEKLGARAWEERLREDLAPLRQLLETQPRVDEVLSAVVRRAQAEAWPSTNPTVQLIHEVQALREKLSQQLAQRLMRDPREPLLELLRELEERVLTAPREVAPEQRWSLALELLPEKLPLVQELASFGKLLAPLFQNPFDPEAPLPFRPGEMEALRRQWPAGEVALALAWSRLSGVDRTGGLVNELRKRAERAALQPPSNGPEHLLCAEYWRSVARKRLEALVRTRVRPLQPTASECLKLAWWLCERELSPEVRLPASEVASDARAGLIELACQLQHSLHPENTEEPPRLPDEEWERLRERALRADQLPQGPDGERVRNVLRTFIWKRAMGNAVMRGWRETAAGLTALVEQAWRVDR